MYIPAKEYFNEYFMLYFRATRDRGYSMSSIERVSLSEKDHSLFKTARNNRLFARIGEVAGI